MSGNIKRKPCAYNTEFKLKAGQYSHNRNNNRQMALEFNVSEKQMQNWRKAALDLAKIP